MARCWPCGGSWSWLGCVAKRTPALGFLTQGLVGGGRGGKEPAAGTRKSYGRTTTLLQTAAAGAEEENEGDLNLSSSVAELLSSGQSCTSGGTVRASTATTGVSPKPSTSAFVIPAVVKCWSCCPWSIRWPQHKSEGAGGGGRGRCNNPQSARSGGASEGLVKQQQKRGKDA